MKKKVTLSLESQIYKDFQKYCEDKGLLLSKQIEFLIQDKLAGKKGVKNE